MNKELVIKCKNLNKVYDSEVVINNISMEVEKGEIVGVLGKNGAGKTTLFKILLGLIKQDPPPDGGEAYTFNIPSSKLNFRHMEKIGFISDDVHPVLWSNLVNLRKLYEKIYSNWNNEIYKRLVDEWEIDCKKELILLSKGQRRLAELILMCSYQPQIIFLDEPFNGLDAVNRFKILHILKENNQINKSTILLDSHKFS